MLLADGEEQLLERGQYFAGSVLSEAPEHKSLEELVELAQERKPYAWKKMVFKVKSREEAVFTWSSRILSSLSDCIHLEFNCRLCAS